METKGISIEEDNKNIAKILADDAELKRVIESRQILVFIRSFYNRLTNIENRETAVEEALKSAEEDVSGLQDILAEMELEKSPEEGKDTPKNNAEISVTEVGTDDGIIGDEYLNVSSGRSEVVNVNCGTCLYSEIEEKKNSTHLRCLNRFAKRYRQNVGWANRCDNWHCMDGMSAGKSKFSKYVASDKKNKNEQVLITSIDVDSGQETVVIED